MQRVCWPRQTKLNQFWRIGLFSCGFRWWRYFWLLWLYSTHCWQQDLWWVFKINIVHCGFFIKDSLFVMVIRLHLEWCYMPCRCGFVPGICNHPLLHMGRMQRSQRKSKRWYGVVWHPGFKYGLQLAKAASNIGIYLFRQFKFLKHRPQNAMASDDVYSNKRVHLRGQCISLSEALFLELEGVHCPVLCCDFKWLWAECCNNINPSTMVMLFEISIL